MVILSLMLIINCPRCTDSQGSGRQILGYRQLVTLHNTDAGPMGEIVCTNGHRVLHDFRRRTTVAIEDVPGPERPATASL